MTYITRKVTITGLSFSENRPDLPYLIWICLNIAHSDHN